MTTKTPVGRSSALPTRPAVHLGPGYPGPGAGLAVHPVAECRRIRQAGRNNVARGDLDPSHAHWLRPVEAQLVQGLEDPDELIAEAVLEGHPSGLDPA
jgi:hypothetical protein